MSKNKQTFKLPDGTEFTYDTTMSQEDIVKQYNSLREQPGNEDLPEMRMGAPAQLRALLSDQPQEITAATLGKLFPWSQQLTSGFSEEDLEPRERPESFSGKVADTLIMKPARFISDAVKNMASDAGPFNMYYDPDSGVIFTMDEPGMTGGDIADIAKPAVGIGAEAAALAASSGGTATTIPGRVGQAAARGSFVGPVGAGAEEAYTQGARMFGLEDPRTFSETMQEFATDSSLRALFEASVPVPGSTAGRGLLKRASRLRGDREAIADSLEVYRRGIGGDPTTMGMVSGEGSSIRQLENKGMEYFHETGGSEVRDAISETGEHMRNRMDEILRGRTAPPGEQPFAGGFSDVEQSPFNVGTEMRRDIYGISPEPYYRSRAKKGGYVETAAAQKDAVLGDFSKNFPGSTRLYPEHPKVGLHGEVIGGSAGRRLPPGRGGASVVVNPVAGEAPSLRRIPPKSRPYRDRAPLAAPDQPVYKLNQVYDDLAANAVKYGSESVELKAAGNIINNPDATLSDLIDLRGRIGKNGMGIEGVKANEAKRLYQAIDETIVQMIGDNGALLHKYRVANRLAEDYYYTTNHMLNRAFKVAGEDVPAEKFYDKIWRATGVGESSGDSVFLKTTLGVMEPETADFVRAGVLRKVFSPAKSMKAGITRWESIPNETKDIIAPVGTYWRSQIDNFVIADQKLGLTDRIESAKPKGSIVSKESRSTTGVIRSSAMPIVTGAGVGAALSLLGSPAATITSAGVTTAAGLYMAKELFGDVSARLAMRGKSRALRSPAFMEWVSSVSNAIPDGKLTVDSAIDFLLSAPPRILYEAENMSYQDMKDMQDIQSAYLAVVEEAVRMTEGGVDPEGILGPRGRPPAITEGLFSTTFTDTSRR